MKRLIPFFALLLLSLCQCSRQTEQNTVPPLLKKSIAYHDPEGNWQHFKSRLYLIHTDTTGKETPFEVEIDNNTGYFSHISHKDNKEIVKGISPDGTAFFLVNGNKQISDEEREKYNLTSKSAEGTRDFYLHLYGLPMKLTDAGTLVSDSIYTENFHGRDLQVMEVNYDPAVGNDNWSFYFDPETAAMKAYRFDWGDPEAGEYVLLDEELMVNGIALPKIRKWYFTKEDQYLGTDALIKAEEFDTHRN